MKTKMMKKVLIIVIGILMILSLAACGSAEKKEEAAETAAEEVVEEAEEAEAEAEAAEEATDEATEEATEETDVDAEAVKSAAYNKVLDSIVPAASPDGQLTVATSPDFAPMEFVDLSKDGDDQFVGFDILLAKYIAAQLNKELVIKPMSFDAVMAAVQTGSVDLGMAGFSWTSTRTFWRDAPCAPILSPAKSAAVCDKEGQFNTAADFAGLKIGAQGASLQKVLVEGQLIPEGAEIQLFENLNDAVAALLTDKIDALAVAFGNGEAFISANQGEIAFSGFEFEVDDMYKNNVILVNSGNEELGNQVNEVLAQIKADNTTEGWYEACQLLAEIKTIDELGYDDQGNKISE